MAKWLISPLIIVGLLSPIATKAEVYNALCDANRNNVYPQFTDHYFTGEYPIKPVDQITDEKVTQLSFLSGKSNN